MGRKIYYTAGPYGAATREQRDVNAQRAAHVAQQIWKLGHVAICPHLNTYEFGNVGTMLDHMTFLPGDFEIIFRCDGVVMLPYWEDSVGAKAELFFALWLDLPIWYYPNLPEAIQ